jgi:NTE family protein
MTESNSHLAHRARIAHALAAAGVLLAAAPPAAAVDSAPAAQGAFTSQSTPAAPVTAADTALRRPRIGLVLAGGGAKGGAHVGVLEVLEEMHVPIDCIAGTSMGSLVGGGYASGIPAAELETFLVGIDWPKVVGGQGLRELAPIEQKRAGATYSNDLDMGLRDGEIIVPGGLLSTSGIDDLLRSYVAKARSQSDFDKLPIPYRAVATDMVSGQMVVLGSGDLATAMRASMAIPGAFAPVHLDKYILSDGGMVRNLPVDVARNLCADVVIVVNLVTEPTTPDKLQTATQLAGRAMDVMLEANVQLQLQTLKPGDVRIDVQMGDIGTADFERVPDTIPLGVTAARAMAGELAKYSVPPGQYAAWRKHVTSGQEIDARVADVKFEGLQWMNPAYLETRTDIQPGDTVDNERISEQAREMSALKDLDSVGYQLTGDPQNPTLTWLPKEKNWGPNFVQFDLGLYATQGNDSGFVLYVKQDRRWLNSLGLQWRNEIQLGLSNELATSLYQPLDVAQRFFVEPKAFFSRTYENLYVNDDRIANYRFDDWGGQVDLGVNFGTRAQLRLGYVYDNRSVTLDTGSSVTTDTGTTVLPNIGAVDAGIISQAIWDTRDTAFNPTHGVVAAVEYLRSDTSLGADRNWERIEAGLGVAVPIRGDIVWITAAGGTDFNSDLPLDRDFALGGPGSFPGLPLDALRAPEYWTLNGSYLWKLKDIQSIRGQALYAGMRLETGEIDNWAESKGLQPIYGGSIYIAGRTIVGPLTIGVGGTSLNTWTVWLAVGRPVGQGTILERGIFR